MICPECRGNLFTEGRFDIAQMFRDAPVVVKNVVAAKCDQCGYLVIAAATARALEDTLLHGTPGIMPARVYDLALPSITPIATTRLDDDVSMASTAVG